MSGKKEAKEQLVGEFKKFTVKDAVYMVIPFLSIALLVILWISVSNNRPDLFPTIPATWARFIKLWTTPIMHVSYLGHVWASLKRILIALVFAWVLGISFGVLIGWNRKMDSFFGTIFSVIRPVPPIAWIPLLTIWMGAGEFPKILIVFIGAVMPVVVNTHNGLRNVEKLYLDVGEVFHANKRQMLLEIAIRAAFPSIFAGIRTSTSMAWMVVLAAEMIGASKGVGFLVVRGMESNDLALVLVAMVTIGIVGALISVLTEYLERWMCPWLNKNK